MFSTSTSQRPDVALVSGQRKTSQLLNGKRNKVIQLLVGCDFITTTPLTGAIRNRGSILACFPEIGLAEKGTPRILGDARIFGFASDANRPSAGTATRLTSLANGTTKLREVVRLHLENPFSANPRETQFMEKDVQGLLEAFAKFTNDVSRIVDVGTGAATISNPFVRVLQVYDEDETALPYFRPEYEEILVAVNAAQPKFLIPLNVGDYLRGLTIQQDSSGVGEVSDIISAIQLNGDRRAWVGTDGPVNFEDLARGMEFEFGGNVYAGPAGSYLHMNFQEQGRLAKIVNPGQDTNLRLTLTVAPSAVAGAGSSYIRVLLHKLVRDPFVGPNGRTVVDPQLPIPA